MPLFSELKHRRVFRVTGIYAVVSWIVIQVATTTFPYLMIPDWGVRMVIALFLLGFPVVVVLAWMFDITPGGVKRTLAASARPNPAAPASFWRAPLARMLAAGTLVVAITGLAVSGRLILPLSEGGAPAEKAASSPRSLAVMPFSDMSQGQDHEYFSDGITEEILNALTQVPGLKVAARTSSFSFKGKSVPIGEVARQLGVDYVLEGSVRKDGSRLRITAQLVNASDGFHLWSETYDRELKDAFAIQDEISRAIATALRVKLAAGQDTRMVEAATSDTRAHDLYLQGMAALNRRDMNKAIGRFEEAIERDSAFARAFAALGLAHAVRPFHDNTVHPLQSARRGREATERALALNPALADAQMVLGILRAYYDWDLAAGERELRRAIEMNPNHADAHRWLAQILVYNRRYEESLAEARRAAELDPLWEFTVCTEGRILTHARQYEAAIRQLERQEREKNLCRGFLHWTYLASGKYREAADVMLSGWRSSTDPNAPLQIQALEEILFALADGQRPRTERLQRLEQTLGGGGFVIAELYAVAGDSDNAMRWLERAYAERRPDLLWATTPLFDALRSDRRYRALIGKIGIPINE